MQWFRKLLAWRAQAANVSPAAMRRCGARVAIYGALLLLVAGAVVHHLSHNRKATVASPPAPARREEPRMTELRDKIAHRQRSSIRPSMTPRLAAARESTHLALPEIKIDSKLVANLFQPKFKAVADCSPGADLVAGEGVSAVDFFGVQAKGGRIAILVDVSIRMVESAEEPGKGFADYLRVKDRVGSVIDSLKDGTLFNVVVFAEACSEMEPKMVFAGNETRKEARKFIQPFNTDRSNYGLETGNFSGGGGLQAAGGTTRMDLALAAAMKDGADAILIITDGLPEVTKVVDPAQAHDTPHGGGAPALPPPENWKLPDFIKHISLLYDETYKATGLKPPVIGCIGYQVDKEGDAFLRQLAGNYKGQYRLVRVLPY
jgi:hypothetical protein